MSITPTPSFMPQNNAAKNVSIKNEHRVTEENISRNTGRRKQCFPTKASSEDQPTDLIKAYRDTECENDYLSDFTGNNSWQIVKSSRVK